MNEEIKRIADHCLNTSPFGDGYIVDSIMDKGSSRIDFLMKNERDDTERMLRVTRVETDDIPASDECFDIARSLSVSLTGCVYNVGREIVDGREYCFAETAKSIRGNILPVDGVLNMGMDICKALSELCTVEYLHRNVKPANISCAGGVYYLNSFDLVEKLGDCGPDNYLGTPTYMAPEVYNNARYSYSSDVYSLGITMYAMLNDGKLPFEKECGSVREATRKRVAGARIPSIIGIDERFMNIILKACEPDPAKRYSSPGEMNLALIGYYKDRSRDRSNNLEYVMDELRTVPEFASHWSFESCLGAGAYGVVFRVTDRTDNIDPERPYALKVISIPKFSVLAGLDEINNDTHNIAVLDELMSRTSREQLIWDMLNNKRNIVHLLDYGRVNRNSREKGFYYWMLSELLSPIDESICDENTVARIGYDISAALADAHSCGITHRDVKPSNILYSTERGYLLGDFGVSRLLKDNASASRTGTINYMAPEILKAILNNNQAVYNFQVDIYSLGITMYTLLNEGRGPFMNDLTLSEQTKDKKERCVPGVRFPCAKYASDRIMRIINKACASDPENRYKSAEDMREAIENIMFY